MEKRQTREREEDGMTMKQIISIVLIFCWLPFTAWSQNGYSEKVEKMVEQAAQVKPEKADKVRKDLKRLDATLEQLRSKTDSKTNVNTVKSGTKVEKSSSELMRSSNNSTIGNVKSNSNVGNSNSTNNSNDYLPSNRSTQRDIWDKHMTEKALESSEENFESTSKIHSNVLNRIEQNSNYQSNKNVSSIIENMRGGKKGNDIQREERTVSSQPKPKLDLMLGVKRERSGEELWQIHRSFGKLTKEEEGRLSEWLKRQDVEF